MSDPLRQENLKTLVVALWLASLTTQGMGRDDVAQRLGAASGSTIGTDLSRDAADLGRRLELHGLIPRGAVTGYIRRGDFTMRPRSSAGAMTNRWQELIAIENERSGQTPPVRHPLDVLADAEALLDDLVTKSDRAARASLVDTELAKRTITGLVELATRPFSVQREASHLLAAISCHSVGPILEAIRTDPVGELLARPLERAARNELLTSEERKSIRDTAQAPPERPLIRRVPWLRLIRRCMVMQVLRKRPIEHWTFHQLQIALNRERSYAWVTPAERRFAYWIVDEMAHESILRDRRSDAVIRSIDEMAKDDPVLQPLVGLVPRDSSWSVNRDRVQIAPENGWPIAEEVTTALDGSWFFVPRSGSPQWPGAFRKRSRQVEVRTLLTEAITTPCAIRFATALAAIDATAPLVREHACTDLADVLSRLEPMWADKEAEPILERSALAIGYLRGRSGANKLIDMEYRKDLPDTLRQNVTWALGDVLGGRPQDTELEEEASLRATAEMETAICKAPSLTSAPSVVAAALRGAAVSRMDLGRLEEHLERHKNPQIEGLRSWYQTVCEFGVHGTNVNKAHQQQLAFPTA